MAWNLVVHNGVFQLQDPGPAVAFLRSHPPGVYTTTRSTNNASHLLLWTRHLERLAQSVKLLSKEMPYLFPNNPAKLPHFDDHLKSIIQPSLSMGLQKAIEVRSDGEELMLMTFVTGSTDKVKKNTHSDEHNGFEVYVHVSRCITESVAKSPTHLAVMGPGRHVPNAKHSEWVRTRQVLEQSRPKGVTEIILSNDGDLLLEGITTNFFVVVSRRKGMVMEANIRVDGEKKFENVMLQTAPLKGVLPGVLRKLILEICAEQRIPCEEVPPSWRDRHMWIEAFTTNSVRLIQPVGSIQCPIHWDCMSEPENWQEKSWESLVLQAPGNLTQFIQNHVQNKFVMHSVSIDSLLKSSY